MSSDECTLIWVEGGIVQECTAHSWTVFDWDNFEDDPVEYWNELDEDSKRTLQNAWPALYERILPAYNEAKQREEEEAFFEEHIRKYGR